MKAGVLETIEHLTVKELPVPALESGSVLIRVKVCSICSTDIRTYRYGHPRVQLPHVIGHEITGEIAVVGKDVTGFPIGDRVTVTPKVVCGKCHYCLKDQPIYCLNSLTFGFQLPGGFAEYLLVPRRGVESGVIIPVPDNLTDEEAALAEPLSCCLRAQKNSRLGPGDTAVIIGGGPIGLMHCRLAKAGQAQRVILVERDIHRLEHAILDAIDLIIDSSKTDPKAEIDSITGGIGADVVIVACSSTQAQEQSLSLAGKGGRINFFGGLPAGQSAIHIDSNIIHYQEIALLGSHSSTPVEHREALDLLARGAIDVRDLTGHSFPLDRIQEAFQLAASNSVMHVSVHP